MLHFSNILVKANLVLYNCSKNDHCLIHTKKKYYILMTFQKLNAENISTEKENMHTNSRGISLSLMLYILYIKDLNLKIHEEEYTVRTG